MSLNDSLLRNAEQSTTLKPQTGSSIFDINSRHPVMSTNSFSRQFKATESSKLLGKISSKLIMSRSARTPPSTVLTSFEGSSGPAGSAHQTILIRQYSMFFVKCKDEVFLATYGNNAIL